MKSWKSFCLQLAHSAAAAYFFLMFLCYPLAKWHGYQDLLGVKTVFFYGAAAVCLACALPWLVVSCFEKKGKLPAKNVLFGAEYALCLFLCVVFLSFLLNGPKMQLFWGGYGRNFGFFAILCCVLSYFFVSRFFKCKAYFFSAALMAVCAVAFLAVLNFFGLDPLSMYASMEPDTQFISTMGNMNVYAAYLGLFLPAGMALFFSGKGRRGAIGFGAACFLGFLGMPASNSDSAYLCVGAAFLLLMYAADSAKKGIRVCVLLTEYAAAELIFGGIYRAVGTGRALKLKKGLPIWLLDGRWNFLLLSIALACCFGLFYRGKKGAADVAWKWLRRLFFILCALFAVSLAGLLLSVNFGMEPEEAKRKLGVWRTYFYFGDAWGTKRMQIWKGAIHIFSRMGILGKLFGAGPAGFYFAAKEYLSEGEMAAFEKRGLLLDAHNVYLQLLVTVGVLGLLAYAAFLALMLRRFFQRAKEDPSMLAFFMPLASYVIQAFVNNVHIYIEPLLFLWAAAGISVCCKAREGTSRAFEGRGIRD